LGQFRNQVGTPFARAATLAHEFGHNLGLTHCGNMDPGAFPTPACNTVGSFPPNVPSIMSYYYQICGVRANLLTLGLSTQEAALFKEMDYSHGTMCTLNEASLDEGFGTGMTGVDWNCDSSVAGIVSQDLNGSRTGWCGANTGLQLLSDYDEWSNIQTASLGATASNLTYMPMSECITAAEAKIVAGVSDCTPPTVTNEPCEDRRMIYLSPSGSGGPNGNCTASYNSVQAAHDAATDGSVLFFRAGSYPQGGRVLLARPMKLFSQPTAGQSTTVITAP
jgi:hypothetical protein